MDNNRKKVVLINSSPKETINAFIPKSLPLAVLSLASTLLDTYEVVILDRAVSKNDKLLESHLQDKNTICVGISVLTGLSIKDAIYCSELTRKINSKVKIVWGGWHPTKVPESVLSKDFVDYIVQGEGEISFKELLSFIENNEPSLDIPGVGYTNNGQIILNPFQPLEISQLPSVPFQLIENIEPYIINNWFPGGDRCVPLETSRGCPFACSFCEIGLFFGKHYGYRKAQQIVDDVLRLKKMFNIGGIRFYDPNFFLKIKRVREFANLLIENNIDIKWGGSGTIKQFVNISTDDLKLFKQAGLRSVSFGIESGDDRFRNEVLNKKFTNDMCLKVFKNFLENDIPCKFNLIVGFPGETYQESLHTLDFALSIINNFPNTSIGSHINIYMPFPGTKLTEVAKELGYNEPNTLEGFSSINFIEGNLFPWLSKSHSKKLSAISIMSCFLSATEKDIPFEGVLNKLFSLLRRYSLYRLNKHWLLKTPDLYLLQKYVY